MGALGFEVLRLGRARVRGFAHFGTRVATLVSGRSLGPNKGTDPRPENEKKFDKMGQRCQPASQKKFHRDQGSWFLAALP